MPPLSFSLDPFRSGPVAGTFLSGHDHSSQVEDHWLGLIQGIQARDVAVIAGHLPGASGVLNLRTRSHRLRKGRLPHRVDALLAHNDAFAAHQLRRARRFSRLGETGDGDTVMAEDAPAWVQARELVQWTVPDLVPAVIRQRHAKSWTTERWWTQDASAGWIAQDRGTLTELLQAGSARGKGPWNPAWPDLVSALAMVCLDHTGRSRFRDAEDRTKHHKPYAGEDFHASWLTEFLPQPLTREDAAEQAQRLRNVVRASDTTNPLPPLTTVWDRALADSVEQADRDDWDLPTWNGWARRWMLACERVHFPQGTAQVARTFWTRWPDARLPVRRDDSVGILALLGEDGTVFSDARLADWLIHGDGTVRRPAIANNRQAWIPDEGYTSLTGPVQPWTWLEWSIDHDRPGLAQRLVNAGWRLPEGFESSYIPDALPSYALADTVRQWPTLREQRVRRVEAVRLAEIACDTMPHEPGVRVRARL